HYLRTFNNLIDGLQFKFLQNVLHIEDSVPAFNGNDFRITPDLNVYPVLILPANRRKPLIGGPSVSVDFVKIDSAPCITHKKTTRFKDISRHINDVRTLRGTGDYIAIAA